MGRVMKSYVRLMVAISVLAGSTLQSSADEVISMTVRPAVATVHGSARVKVLVARNELNRVLVWEIDGPSYYRSSATELDGASSPRSYFFMAHDLPAGLFDIRVTVKRNDNTEARDRGQIRVAGAAN